MLEALLWICEEKNDVQRNRSAPMGKVRRSSGIARRRHGMQRMSIDPQSSAKAQTRDD